MEKTNISFKDSNQHYEDFREKAINKEAQEVIPFLQCGLADWIITPENKASNFKKFHFKKPDLSTCTSNKNEIVQILATIILHQQKEFLNDCIGASF